MSVGIFAYVRSTDQEAAAPSSAKVVPSGPPAGKLEQPENEQERTRGEDDSTEAMDPAKVDEELVTTELSRGGQGGEADTQRSSRAQRGSDTEGETSRDSSSDRRRQEKVKSEGAGRTSTSRDRSEDGPPVSLSMTHSPLRSARMGSSELITVRMSAPRSTKVVLHSGPAGGPIKRTRLKAKSGGRWEGWIDFKGTSVGDDFSYWLVATHPRATTSAKSGSRSAPHRVSIQ